MQLLHLQVSFLSKVRDSTAPADLVLFGPEEINVGIKRVHALPTGKHSDSVDKQDNSKRKESMTLEECLGGCIAGHVLFLTGKSL